MRLDAILDFEMNELEAQAYKLTLLWVELSHKIFPNYKHGKLKAGNPMKSAIFRQCHKLAREKQGILEEKDYKLYITAQLDILRKINLNNAHPMIDVGCLTSPQAWKRWKLWKKKYDQSTQTVSEAGSDFKIANPKVIEILHRTKEFLFQQASGQPTLEIMEKWIAAKDFQRWINLGKISPYYLVLSPFAQKLCKIEEFEKINFDPLHYKNSLTSDVEFLFKELFPYEFL